MWLDKIPVVIMLTSKKTAQSVLLRCRSFSITYGLWLIGIFFFSRYISADMKFLALILGLQGARANAFCIWCECLKSQIRDFSGKNQILLSKSIYRV